MKNFSYRNHCEICDSYDKKVLISRKFVHPSIIKFINSYYSGRIDTAILSEGLYEVVECNICSFMWQSYILKDELMLMLYERWISAELSLAKKRDAAISLYAGYSREVQAISFLLNKLPNQTKVLDFGMGWGYWCLMAKAHGYQAYGLELSEKRVNFAKSCGINIINNNDLLLNKFDFINSDQVHEHLQRPRESLERLVGALNAGGVLRISVPNGNQIKKELLNPDWVASKNPIQPLEHINCFTRKSLLKIADKVGLAPISKKVLFCKLAYKLPRVFLRHLFANTTIYFVKIN